MYEDFIKERISKLRTQKGVSARDMSLSLGQNQSYINSIELGRFMPSLQGLFYICDYLGVTPKEFFDDGVECPAMLSGVLDELNKLDAEALSDVEKIIKRMNKK